MMLSAAILTTALEESCVTQKKRQPVGCPLDQLRVQDGNGSKRLTRSR